MRNPFPTRPKPHCCHRIGSAGGVLGHSLHSPAQRSLHPCLSFALLLRNICRVRFVPNRGSPRRQSMVEAPSSSEDAPNPSAPEQRVWGESHGAAAPRGVKQDCSVCHGLGFQERVKVNSSMVCTGRRLMTCILLFHIFTGRSMT